MLADHVLTCVSHVRIIRGGKKDYRPTKRLRKTRQRRIADKPLAEVQRHVNII
jgi:hypothetical protein